MIVAHYFCFKGFLKADMLKILYIILFSCINVSNEFYGEAHLKRTV